MQKKVRKQKFSNHRNIQSTQRTFVVYQPKTKKLGKTVGKFERMKLDNFQSINNYINSNLDGTMIRKR